MTATTRAARQRGASAELLDPADAQEERTSRHSRENSPSKSTSPSSEKPVRRQLKKTSITAPEDGTTGQSPSGDVSSEAGSGRSDSRRASPQAQDNQKQPKKKRSFDEVEHDTGDSGQNNGPKHLRKRSKSEEEASPPPLEETDKADRLSNEVSEQTATEKPLDSLATTEISQSAPKTVAREVEDASQTTSDLGSNDRSTQTPPRNTTESSFMDESMPTSPPNKRTREQFANEHHEGRPAILSESLATAIESNNTTNSADTAVPEPTSTTEGPERKKSKEDRPTGAQVTKIPSSSGFSNTSAESPFSAVSTSKTSETQPQTSSSAFSSSGFASFASSSASPFGTFGTGSKQLETKQKENKSDTVKSAASASGFASLGGTSSPFAAAKPSFASGSPFASVSGFGSTSGFGNLSGGFAKPGVGPPLSSFASPNGSSGIIGSSSKPAKPFGAPTEDDDEDDGEASEPEDYVIKPGAEEDRKDPRFFEQDVETGEEGEETIYSTRAKLYVTSEKQWKERSVGVFKVNVTIDDEDDDAEESRRKVARFIMRADGSHRISLNSPITKDIEIRDPTGGPPKGKNAIFLGFIDGQPKLMQLKMKTPQQAIEFHQAVTYLQESM